jgi:thioesterase domain-containing protein
MEKINEEVKFFAMIDSVPPKRNLHLKEKRTEFSVQSELEWLWKYLEDDKIREEVGKAAALDQFWHLIVNYLEKINLDVKAIRKLIPGNMNQGIPNFNQLYYLNVIRTFSRARDNYIPGGKVNTPIHFFLASRSSIEKAKHWQDYLVNPVSFHKITGNHFSIFKLPHVVPFARTFTRIIKNK